MRKKFLLFGEKPFEAYACEKFSIVAAGIESMCDIEALMYKENFEELLNKTVKNYSFPKLEISFENKVVDLIPYPFQNQTRYFAEYSLVVKGDTYFLGLSPFGAGARPIDLQVELRGDIMSFEIDTQYHDEELSREARAHVKLEYEWIRKYIVNTLDNLNQTITYYNEELEKFVIPLLAKKLRRADRCLKIKESLNFN